MVFRFVVAALALAIFRAVPFVVYAFASPNVRWSAKLAVATVFGGVTVLVASSGLAVREVVVRAPLALAYLAVVSLGVYEARGLARSAGGRVVLAIALPLVYVVLPAAAGREETVRPTLLVGWAMGIGAYSFCCATALKEVSWRDALFFLLVDPSLVYEDRARPLPAAGNNVTWGSLRVSAGIGQLIAQNVVALLAGTLPLTVQLDLLQLQGAGSYARFLVSHLLEGFGLFLSHAGLASIQIGYLRLAGLSVIERYDRPYRATSPADFWLRWNRWLGRWARRYLYLPAGMFLQRRLPRTLRTLAVPLAVLVTFGVIGLLHDLVPWAASQGDRDPTRGRPLVMTVAFAVAGATVVLWHSIARTRPFRLTAKALPWGMQNMMKRVLFLHIAAVFLWLVLPAITQRCFPPGIERQIADTSTRACLSAEAHRR